MRFVRRCWASPKSVLAAIVLGGVALGLPMRFEWLQSKERDEMVV
jgi:hypothetical protein